MHEHYKIKETIARELAKNGFFEESENSQIDCYGSIQTTFVCAEKKVLLAWDGEEGFGYAEIWKDGHWTRLATKILESNAKEFDAAKAQLISDLEVYY